MPGVIFLDFDGPIFPNRVFLLPENSGKLAKENCEELNLHPYVNYWKADPISIAMLNRLLTIYPYDLVISSSWADDWLHEKSQIEGLLIKNELNYNLHKTWKTPRDSYNHRHEQIAHWLSLHPEYGNKYIILDDTSSGAGLADKKLTKEVKLNDNNIFLVDVDNGISHKEYLSIVKIMQKW
ncbi:hypothetical protein GW796_10895 [archaeon]|nr:hypothetical protein [archaeon]